MYYYAPINPAGKELSYRDANQYIFPENNSCHYFENEGCFIFTSDHREFWALGGDMKPVHWHCAYKPESLQWVFSGSTGRGPLTLENEVIDSALCYDLGYIEPDEARGVNLYLGVLRESDESTAASKFCELINDTDSKSRLRRSVKYWNDWYAKSKIRMTGDKKIDSYVKRIAIIMKSLIWENGGISCNSGELSQTYFRDSSWAFYGLGMAGFVEDAKKGILCLEGYTYLYGLQNSVLNDEKANAVIKNGFSENMVFSVESKLFSMDDPAILLYTIGKLHRKYPEDVSFYQQVWPLIKHLAALAERDLGKLGTVAQNEGFQDDMIHWRFRRSDNYEKGFKGLECVPWNMLWVTGLDYASTIGRSLGYDEIAEHYEALSNKIRYNIEKYFWNDERKAYAYFYDPDSHVKYGGDRAYEDYTTVAHDTGGHFVYPNHPLTGGLTASIWTDYALDERALLCLKTVREANPELPESVLGMGDESMPSMSTEIIRLTHSMVLAKDPDAEKNFNWLVNNTPLAGMSESYDFPVNYRPVQCWVDGEMLAVFNDWYNINN